MTTVQLNPTPTAFSGMRVVLAACLILACALDSAQAENVLYVSPTGNDAWSGFVPTPAKDGSDGPVATLHRAVELSRRQATGQPRRIELQAGEYYVDRPVELEPGDSGLTIQAAVGADVVLYGGRRISGWYRDGDHLWAADLPEVKEGKWDFRMLAVADRLCPRARLPKEGTFTHETEFKVPWMSTTGGGWKRKPTSEELTTLKYRPEDLAASALCGTITCTTSDASTPARSPSGAADATDKLA